MAEKKDFNLRDYLFPGAKYPYDRLAPDLEGALSRGFNVYLWSVPGFFMLSGSPELVQYDRPWSDGDKWYRTAKDCIRMKNGKKT